MRHFGYGDRPTLRSLTHFATTCALILFSGCGGCGGSYSGESEYEQMMRGKQEFADLIKSAGGTAEEINVAQLRQSNNYEWKGSNTENSPRMQGR